MVEKITKSGVLRFATEKIDARKKGFENDIKLLIEETVRNEVKELPDVHQVEIAAFKFSELMDKAIREHKNILSDGDYTNVVTHTNMYAVSLGHQVYEEVLAAFKKVVDRPYKYSKDFGIDRLNEALNNTVKASLPIKEKIKMLGNMQGEIAIAIRNATTGKRALSALIALGIDMSQYKEITVLPAVVKLSGDVCLINGDC